MLPELRQLPVLTAALVFAASVAAASLLYYPDLSQSGYVFVNVDHLLYISSYLASKRFGSIFDLQTFAFGQGFGIFQHPTFLNPFWWFWDLTHSPQLSYCFSMLTLFCGVLTYFLALRKNSVYWAMLAAFGAGSLVFNPDVMADYFATAMPQTFFQIGIAYMGCAILLGFGARSTGWLLTGIGLLYCAVLIDWPFAMFLVPFIALSGAAALLTLGDRLSLRAAEWRANPRQVFVLVGVTVVAAIVILPPVYVAYDSFALMSLRLWTHFAADHEVKHSLLVWGGVVEWRSAMFLGLAGLMAAVYHIWRDRFRLLVLSLGMMCFLLVLGFFDYDAAGLDVYSPLPALGYFERPFLPLYVILIVAALQDSTRWLAQRLRSSRDPNTTVGHVDDAMAPAFLLLVVAAAGAVGAVVSLTWASWPDELSHIMFRPAVQVREAEEFVKSLPLPTPAPPLYLPYFYDGTKSHLVNDCAHVNDYPNHYCGYMFDLYSAPNAIEFQNLIDIQFQQILSQLALSVLRIPPDNMQFRTLMKSFGIRYVAVDGHPPQAMTRLDISGEEVSLIDLGPIQPDDRSVQKVESIPYTSEDAVAARMDHRAIVHDGRSLRENQSLSPVELADIGYRPGAMVVRARSSGKALLLLPVQFSNCLTVESLGPESARLVRVNGGQAALSFTRQATVAIRNDLRFFGRPTCRYRDFVEVLRMGIFPVQSLEEMTAGYRVPLLVRWYLMSRIKKRDQLLRQSFQ